MTGGLVQLASVGHQDIYLTGDPQITFFKIAYRRHTNFAMEYIPQYFSTQPNFGKRVSCVIGKNGDLISDVFIEITLPSVPPFIDFTNNTDSTLYKFAWMRKIGFALISKVELEINGKVIDRQYGDWLNIWNELIGKNSSHDALMKMIGDIPELYSFTNGKNEHKIRVPLSFWFCLDWTQALPLFALEYSEIKINVEFAREENSYLLAPTRRIPVLESVSSFIPYEFIKQTINNKTYVGQFIKLEYDYENNINYLYYNQIKGELQIPSDEYDRTFTIVGDTSKQVMNIDPSGTVLAINPPLNELTLNKAIVYVNYAYLDIQERIKFHKSTHEYLIHQVQFEKDITANTAIVGENLNWAHPTKFYVMVGSLDYISKFDKFNYTTDYARQNKTNTSIIKKATLKLNGEDLFENFDYKILNYVMPYYSFPTAPAEGVCVFSWSLNPTDHNQPSGTLNMSRINDIQSIINVDSSVTYSNPAKLRLYAVNLNVLRIIHGNGGIAFDT
jgi:hypothetical protein